MNQYDVLNYGVSTSVEWAREQNIYYETIAKQLNNSESLGFSDTGLEVNIDVLKHAIAAADNTLKHGEGLARTVGAMNELYAAFKGRDSVPEHAKDIHNNEVGFAVAGWLLERLGREPTLDDVLDVMPLVVDNELLSGIEGVPEGDPSLFGAIGALLSWGKGYNHSKIRSEVYKRLDDATQDGSIPPRCFPADTQISLFSGETKPISAIVPGDVVLAFDSEAELGRGALVPKKVVRLYRNTTDEWIKLSWVEDGEAKELVTTPGHHFLDEFGQFPTIEEMLKNKVATVVLTSGETAQVSAERIVWSAETAHLFEQAHSYGMVDGSSALKPAPIDGWQTYNFEVEDLHTYVAGGVRVHNDSGFLGMVGNHIDKAFNEGGQIIGGAGDILTAPFHAVGHLANGLIDAGNNFVNNLSAAGAKFRSGDFAGGLVETGKAVLQGIGDVVSAGLGAVGQLFEGVATGINQIFTGNDHGVTDDDDDDDSDAKPIVLDLDGDGIEIEVNGDVSFDMDNDGYLEKTAWASADDGFLVIDLNADGTRGAGDGVIDQSQELVLTEFVGTDAITDLQVLSLFDTLAEWGGNQDGVLDANDTVWSELRVWQDLNQDGVSDAGELKTLNEWGITEVNLTYDDGTEFGDTANDISIFGSTLLGSASMTMNGEVKEGAVGDVALGYQTNGYRRIETANGYQIEFETGETLRYLVMDGTGAQDVSLTAQWLDGVTGDSRANHLDGTGHTHDLQIVGDTDTVAGGNDTIFGGYGNDMLAGGLGADSASTQKSVSSVFEIRHASTLREYQSMIATKYRNPRLIGR